MKTSKVKVHLQKKTNYHTVPVCNEIYIFFDHLSLHILFLFAQITVFFFHIRWLNWASNTYGLSGKTCMKTGVWDRRKVCLNLLSAGKERPALSGSDRSRQGFVYVIDSRHIILSQQHHKPWCVLYGKSKSRLKAAGLTWSSQWLWVTKCCQWRLTESWLLLSCVINIQI